MAYGVAVNNRFDLFVDDEEDPADLLLKQQQLTEKSRVDKTAKTTTTTKKATTSSKPAAITKAPAPSARQHPAGVKSTTTQNVAKAPTTLDASQKAPRQNVVRFTTAPSTDADTGSFRTVNARPDSGFRERPDSRGNDFRAPNGARRGGRGQNRGGPGATSDGGFDRFGKREFERHSGSDKTGLKPVEKRSGGGAHNWGTIADTIEEQLKVSEEGAEQSEVHERVPASSNQELGDDAADAAAAAEEEERQMTLDEWKALQNQQRTKASFNIRKPGEGCSSDPKWKKMQVLKKKEEEEHLEDEQYEDADDEGHMKSKNIIPIQVTFSDNDRRGGRRGGRGRGAGPQQRGSRPAGAAVLTDQTPNFESEQDFPSLS